MADFNQTVVANVTDKYLQITVSGTTIDDTPTNRKAEFKKIKQAIGQLRKNQFTTIIDATNFSLGNISGFLQKAVRCIQAYSTGIIYVIPPAKVPMQAEILASYPAGDIKFSAIESTDVATAINTAKAIKY